MKVMKGKTTLRCTSRSFTREKFHVSTRQRAKCHLVIVFHNLYRFQFKPHILLLPFIVCKTRAWLFTSFGSGTELAWNCSGETDSWLLISCLHFKDVGGITLNHNYIFQRLLSPLQNLTERIFALL